MPVLPELGSNRVAPGVRRPSSSASRIIWRAMRSLTDPPGFWPSIFPRMRTFGLGDRRLTSTSGVLPIMSRTELKTVMAKVRTPPVGGPFLVDPLDQNDCQLVDPVALHAEGPQGRLGPLERHDDVGPPRQGH